jgi:glyoxylase-like metal-dependent hydrolase (beta-lactamase superfamily II)
MTPVPMDPTLLDVVWREAGDARAQELAEGIWCLRVPLPYAVPRWVNAYLLDADDGQLLVDCGTHVGIGWDGLERALSLAGSAPERISTLLCTHLHPDHAAMAPLLVERTGCRVLRGAGPDAITDLLRENSIPLPTRRAAAIRAGVPEHELGIMLEAFTAEDGSGPRVHADRLLDDGELIDSATGSWEVIATPGHSANQIALYEPRRRWLIAADVAYVNGEPFIEYGHTADPLAEHLAAIERLGALPVDLLLPGHGAPDRAPAERFAGARAATLAWLEGVRREISAQGSTAYEVMCALVGHDPDPDRRQSTLSVVLCVLQHLVRAGELLSREDGRVDRFTALAR